MIKLTGQGPAFGAILAERGPVSFQVIEARHCINTTLIIV